MCDGIATLEMGMFRFEKSWPRSELLSLKDLFSTHA